ncbi:VOC family protein [Nocardiopsis sediminis]|uniref:VOC family protein n=1 Tax=Nocardiopsis sediminis TaxID=1778267 RepID=A0ABV8FTJ6_9ACTN
MADGPPRTAGTIRTVLYPGPDIAACLPFYRDGLGLPVRFTDGDRFAALDGGAVTLALASGDEDVTGGVPAIAVEVADVEAAVADLAARGARVLLAPERGPHETRAAVLDPAGNPVVLTARNPR